MPRIHELINFIWANGSVDKSKGGDTTTRTEFETAGSGKDRVYGFGPWELLFLTGKPACTIRMNRRAPFPQRHTHRVTTGPVIGSM